MKKELDRIIEKYEKLASEYDWNYGEGDKAKEYSQIAQLLKELKEYRHFRFIVGETLVDVSKGHISLENALQKIRNKLIDLDYKTKDIIK